MSNKNIICFGLLELILVLIIATGALRLWSIDFKVPFHYQGDALWLLMPVKGMIDNGWVYEIQKLSAPFSLASVAFPVITNLDWGIMKLISLVIDSPGVVFNGFWLFSIMLTAWSATLALRLLGMGNWMALGAGIIYAFLPFAILRNTAHLNLTFYCVPLLSIFAIYLSYGADCSKGHTITKIGYLAAAAQGCNYIYFSFFAVFLFCFGGFLGYRRRRTWRPLRSAAIASGITILTTVLNLMPTYLSWESYGKPPDISYKSPQEAEVFGLKLRKMLAPNQANIVPGFSHWGKLDHAINFPNENENTTARLGPFAAVGFLFLLSVLLGFVQPDINVKQEMGIIIPISSLAIISFLFTTVGGFGAIFNELTVPDIRCYNRFSVFIAFFSIAGLGLWLQIQIRNASSYRVQLMLVGSVILLVIFSLYDQLLDTAYLNNRRPADEESAHYEEVFVRKLEMLLPQETLVFQLPITGFPPDGGKERMLPYDHARPYLWSKHLHWSWPSFSQRHRNWLAQVEDLEGEALAEALILSKFRVVWVDRFGYTDNGERIISTLIEAGARNMLPGAHPRYVALDLDPIMVRLRPYLQLEDFAQRQAALLNAPAIEWISGVYPEEYSHNTGKKFRWSQAESVMKIRNMTGDSLEITISFTAASSNQGNLIVSSENDKLVVPLTSKIKNVEFPITLKPNAIEKIRFAGDMGRMALPYNEKRDLHFYLMDMRLRLPLLTQ